jgi:transcriptional regulator with GAF, ATPase, and Fis domain
MNASEKNKKNQKPNLLLDKVIYISRKINSVYELPMLLDSIMQTTTEIIPSEAASVLILDESKENLVFYSVVGDKKEIIKQFTVPVTKGIAGHTVRERKPVIVNDVATDSRFYREIDQKSEFKTRNIISFPLIVKDEVLGVLEVINALDHEGFKDTDLKILSYISELSALAIYNRVLYDNLERSHQITNKRVQELNALYTILKSFNVPMDKINIRDIFKKAGAIVENTLDCRRVSIFLRVGKDKNYFELISSIGFGEEDLKEGQIISVDDTRIMKMVDQSKKPCYVLNKEQFNFSVEKLLEKYETQHFISLPIFNQEDIIGFINVTEKNAETGEGFDDYDLSLLNSISITLGNIYRQYQANIASLQQTIIQRELDTASAIQRKMLIQNFPKITGVDIYALNIPARNVSGDFYGCLQVSPHELATYIGDVSGKGLPAAFFMATASTSLKEKINFYKTPAKGLRALNQTLFEEVQDGMFVTLANFFINLKEKSILYSFAGHNNQLLYRAATKKVEILKTPGKPIGIMYEVDFVEKKVNFEKNDILLLFTDGVSEAVMNNEEEEGERLLREILTSSCSMGAKDLGKLIKSVFLEEGKELFDDFTLLVIKF